MVLSNPAKRFVRKEVYPTPGILHKEAASR
jgi:hypothetical protein